jgi:hypothetical protein
MGSYVVGVFGFVAQETAQFLVLFFCPVGWVGGCFVEFGFDFGIGFGGADVEPLGFDGVIQDVEFPIDEGFVGGAQGLFEAAVIFDFLGFEDERFDGAAAVANSFFAGFCFSESREISAWVLLILSQAWNEGGAETLSDEGYVADSVGEEKFRRLVTGFGFGVERCASRNGNEGGN